MPSFPTGLRRVAIYLRKSRADMEAEARGEGETLAKHRKALFSIAKRYLYTVIDIFEELVSGERIIDRPEMQKLLHNVQDGKYDAVLCMDMDRLGRGNMIDQGLIQEAFKTTRTLIITPRKVYDLEDEHDEEWSEFEAFMARRELKIITRRMQRGRRLSAQDGKSITKGPPYGYLRDEHFKLHADPELAPIVRQIFGWHAEGNGLIKICNMLNDMRIPSPSGGFWNRTTVRHILHNEAYLGRIIWGMHRYVKGGAGKYIKTNLPRDQWIIVDNAHEPIISQELWDAAHRMHEQMTPRVRQDLTVKNPFASILRCKECGKTMRLQSRATRDSGHGQDSVKCITYQCNTRQTLIRLLEPRVLADLETIIASAPDLNAESDEQQQDQTAILHRKLAALRDELERLDIQKSNLFDLLEQKVYDVDTFMHRSKTIAERIDVVSSEIRQTEQALQEQMERASNKQNLIPALSKMVKAYRKTTDPKAKNALLKSVIDHIDYTRHKEWPNDKECELEYYFRL